MEAAKKTKFGTKVAWGEDDAQTSNTHIAQRKWAIPHLTMKRFATYDVHCSESTGDTTSVLVTALCNQPKVFA